MYLCMCTTHSICITTANMVITLENTYILTVYTFAHVLPDMCHLNATK